MNTGFNMEDVFDRIDSGLEAFEKLVDFMKNFPNYDLNKDVELMHPKENGVFKDFIKFGTAVVGVHHQPLQGGRISSSSAPQPSAGGYVGGGGQGLAGWSEARPTP